MNRLLIASVLSAAFALPAVAQMSPPNTAATQMNSGAMAGATNNAVNPRLDAERGKDADKDKKSESDKDKKSEAAPTVQPQPDKPAEPAK